MSVAEGMLNGVKVVDLTSVVFGPYATFLLAELGAEVIKVEPPQGDQMRHLGKPAKTRGMSPTFVTINQGKKSVMLDLKQEEGRNRMLDLIAGADIFIHNVRKEPIERLSLTFEDAVKVNPEIIYMHCVGFGSKGAYAGLQAYDDVIQAASGATSLSHRVDGGPPRYIPSLIGDKVSGLYAVKAALAAYIHKLRTGEGQYVEVPMFEAFTQFMMLEHLGGKVFDPPNAPACYPRQVDPNRQPFPTKDGHISIVPYTDSAWEKVFGVLGYPELLELDQFSSPKSRFNNIDKLYQEIAKITPQHSTQHWLTSFHSAGIPAMIARDVDDIFEDPHLNDVSFFERLEHPSEGGYFAMRRAVHYENFPERERKPAPLLGEHNDEFF